MDKNAYRAKLKRRLGIKSDDENFDEDLDDFVQESVANLFPVVQKELKPFVVTLPAWSNVYIPVDGDIDQRVVSVRRLEIEADDGTWQTTDEFSMHDQQLILYESFSSDKKLKIYGLGRHSYADVPFEVLQVVINWAMSEFYSMLIGDKRKYNIYTQSNGARSVDNFTQLSQHYLERGNQLLADRATIRGL